MKTFSVIQTWKTILSLVCLCLTSLAALSAEVPLSPESQAAYKAHLARATTLVEQEKVEEAMAQVKAARTLNPKGYEAPATLALILQASGKSQEAAAAIAEALKLAPAEARPRVAAIAKLVGPPAALPPAATATPAAEKKPSTALTGTARRRYDTLLVIVGEADQAKSADDRKKLLEEFLTKSTEFVGEYPGVFAVWVLRAGAALEMEQEKVALVAGSELLQLGAEDMDDPKIRQLLAQLDRKGWLKTPQQLAELKAGEESRIAERKAAEERRLAAEREAEVRREAERRKESAERKKQLLGTYGGVNAYVDSSDFQHAANPYGDYSGPGKVGVETLTVTAQADGTLIANGAISQDYHHYPGRPMIWDWEGAKRAKYQLKSILQDFRFEVSNGRAVIIDDIKSGVATLYILGGKVISQKREDGGIAGSMEGDSIRITTDSSAPDKYSHVADGFAEGVISYKNGSPEFNARGIFDLKKMKKVYLKRVD